MFLWPCLIGITSSTVANLKDNQTRNATTVERILSHDALPVFLVMGLAGTIVFMSALYIIFAMIRKCVRSCRQTKLHKPDGGNSMAELVFVPRRDGDKSPTQPGPRVGCNTSPNGMPATGKTDHFPGQQNGQTSTPRPTSRTGSQEIQTKTTQSGQTNAPLDVDSDYNDTRNLSSTKFPETIITPSNRDQTQDVCSEKVQDCDVTARKYAREGKIQTGDPTYERTESNSRRRTTNLRGLPARPTRISSSDNLTTITEQRNANASMDAFAEDQHERSTPVYKKLATATGRRNRDSTRDSSTETKGNKPTRKSTRDNSSEMEEKNKRNSVCDNSTGTTEESNGKLLREPVNSTETEEDSNSDLLRENSTETVEGNACPVCEGSTETVEEGNACPVCEGSTETVEESNTCPVCEGSTETVEESNACPVCEGSTESVKESNACPVCESSLETVEKSNVCPVCESSIEILHHPTSNDNLTEMQGRSNFNATSDDSTDIHGRKVRIAPRGKITSTEEEHKISTFNKMKSPKEVINMFQTQRQSTEIREQNINTTPNSSAKYLEGRNVNQNCENETRKKSHRNSTRDHVISIPEERRKDDYKRDNSNDSQQRRTRNSMSTNSPEIQETSGNSASTRATLPQDGSISNSNEYNSTETQNRRHRTSTRSNVASILEDEASDSTDASEQRTNRNSIRKNSEKNRHRRHRNSSRDNRTETLEDSSSIIMTEYKDRRNGGSKRDNLPATHDGRNRNATRDSRWPETQKESTSSVDILSKKRRTHSTPGKSTHVQKGRKENAVHHYLPVITEDKDVISTPAHLIDPERGRHRNSARNEMTAQLEGSSRSSRRSHSSSSRTKKKRSPNPHELNNPNNTNLATNNEMSQPRDLTNSRDVRQLIHRRGNLPECALETDSSQLVLDYPVVAGRLQVSQHSSSEDSSNA